MYYLITIYLKLSRISQFLYLSLYFYGFTEDASAVKAGVQNNGSHVLATETGIKTTKIQ